MRENAHIFLDYKHINPLFCREKCSFFKFVEQKTCVSFPEFGLPHVVAWIRYASVFSNLESSRMFLKRSVRQNHHAALLSLETTCFLLPREFGIPSNIIHWAYVGPQNEHPIAARARSIQHIFDPPKWSRGRKVGGSTSRCNADRCTAKSVLAGSSASLFNNQQN